MIHLTEQQLIDLLLKATNWELYATEYELFKIPIREAKNSVINRLIARYT